MENASDTVMKTNQRKLATAKSSLIGSLARHLLSRIIGIPRMASNQAIVDMMVEIVSKSIRMNVFMEKLWASIITFLGDRPGTIRPNGVPSWTNRSEERRVGKE